MLKRIASTLAFIGVSTCTAAGVAGVAGEPCASEAAALIGSSSGLAGGICVVLGRTDADLAIAISKHGPFTVQALYPDRALVDKARKTLRANGVYGTVSADLSGCGRLPYAENLVNLVVADDYLGLKAKGLAVEEILRVLTPLGVAYLGDSHSSAGAEAPWVTGLVSELRACGMAHVNVLTDSGTWVKVVKPWPRGIDEWTHYLHGPDGNPVAQDRVVGPPKHYQWIVRPMWLRSHETVSSISTLVTSRGRLFYIVDEAPISLAGDHPLPDKWCLTARDAFNGVLLWRVPIRAWGWREWKSTWFSARPGDMPLNLQKRLVAAGDRLYVTLGYRAPVSELDAKTGAVLKTYEDTERTSEILHREGVLVLTVLVKDGAKVMAVDARSGARIWTTKKSYRGTTTDYLRWKTRYAKLKRPKLDPTLNTATDGRVVALLDGMDVVGLDFKTGEERWRTAFPDKGKDLHAGGINVSALWVGTTIVHDNAVLHASPRKLVCFSADTGEMRWSQPKQYIGHLWYAWKDVFVIRGLVWTWSDKLESNTYGSGEKTYRTNSPVTVNGYDLHTGKLKRKVPLGGVFKAHHHHRCYRNKATLRYILASRRGTEFIDLEEGKHTVHNWVRGTCHMGMMPANGLHYAPPHPCVCYADEKLNGMNALAPELPSRHRSEAPNDAQRLERGPAYGKVIGTKAGPEDWPTFRHDPMRTGSVNTRVPERLKPLWRVSLGGKVSGPIVVGDRLFVPLVDQHHLVALSVSDGSKIWECASGGRIDSPPTYYRGTVIFGSADGRVYCVRASDGRLVWMFRAAPEERRIGAFGQLESAWPVHGSVLVQDDTVYFVAGRTSHLDGGMVLYGIDAVSGRLRHQTRLAGPDYTVETITRNHRLPMGALPDILMGDNTSIYMRTAKFDARLKRQRGRSRLQATGGFLDDSYFKRAPWSFGKRRDYARLIVHDERSVYFARMFDTLRGLDPSVYFTPGKEGYLLFAKDMQSGKKRWSCRIPVRIRAMVVTDGLLFVAGPPDVLDPNDPLGAFEGRKGGTLDVIESSSGKKLTAYKLPSPPVFNGVAAANGRLYLSMEDGSVACYGQHFARRNQCTRAQVLTGAAEAGR